MTLQQIIDLQKKQRSLEIELPFKIKKRGILRAQVGVNGFFPIPIENIANLIDRSNDIPITENTAIEIGYVCFIKGNQINNLDALTEFHFVCGLIEAASESELLNGDYIFKSDYVIIYQNHLINYLEQYSSSAPLWGYFNHTYPGIAISSPTTITRTNFQADSYTRFSNTRYYETSIRGIKQLHAFERFLKYYHLLELNFDFDVIERVKNLDVATNAQNIATILKEWKREDIERLNYLSQTYCSNIGSIVDRMNHVRHFIPQAKDIFYEFGKDSNPLKEFSNFLTIANSIEGFVSSKCKAVLGKQCNDSDLHRKFIGKLCMYWIYRIRSSIAHNKMGEYLMIDRDEKFIVEFAEPLLLEVLKQVLK